MRGSRWLRSALRWPVRLRIASGIVALGMLLLSGMSGQVLAAATPGGGSPSTGVGSAGSENPNAPWLFGLNAHPYGTSMATWGQRIAQWIYQQPPGTNPMFDQTGADCANEQQGHVWFIPPIFSPQLVSSGTRRCTVPAGKAIFLDIGANVEDYPCPQPGFQPAPGQSLYNFLLQQDLPVMNSVNDLAVSINGHPLRGVLRYRYTSPRTFQLTGSLALQPVYDSCITGTPQPAIVDGFFMMFKPLRPGRYTLVVFGTNTFGAVKTYTYDLTVAGRGSRPGAS